MKIESLKVHNYKVFKDAEVKSIPNMAVFLGKNGVGKSTFFDVFGFMHDCLSSNVRTALAKRGGFREVLSRDQNQDGKFKNPFSAKYVSDGTIKMFTYLVLLHDPVQHALMCIEEPENQLYPALLEALAEEFRAYTESDGQVFISTHSPDFLNAVDIEEVFYLEKVDGFTKIKKVSDNALAKSLYEAGDLLGALWKQGLLTED